MSPPSGQADLVEHFSCVIVAIFCQVLVRSHLFRNISILYLYCLTEYIKALIQGLILCRIHLIDVF